MHTDTWASRIVAAVARNRPTDPEPNLRASPVNSDATPGMATAATSEFLSGRVRVRRAVRALFGALARTDQPARWTVGGLVTVAAICAATWICGALILPIVMKSHSNQWSVARLIAAFTGIVALFSYRWGFATARRSADESPRKITIARPGAKVTVAPRQRIAVTGSPGAVAVGEDQRNVFSPGDGDSTGHAEPQ